MSPQAARSALLPAARWIWQSFVKTTLVPLALLDEPWLAGQRILMLEPRRMAARAAAAISTTPLR